MSRELLPDRFRWTKLPIEKQFAFFTQQLSFPEAPVNELPFTIFAIFPDSPSIEHCLVLVLAALYEYSWSEQLTNNQSYLA
jgi:hypothetical protein